MVDYDIIDINEYIDGLSYEEQLEYLKDKEAEIDEAIEELNSLLSDIEERKEEIEKEHQQELLDKVVQNLNSSGYDVVLNDDGSILFGFEESTITISNPFSDTIMFYFNTIDKHISSYRNMISSLLPDYKQNGNCFSKAVTEETLEDDIISLVKRLKK
jgi:predicted AlkP superfamily phosphohydrolase/phosphomutase